MKKHVIIINGKGKAGKDTLCEFAGKTFKCVTISAITPIKNIAAENGWNGEKDPKSRKFLADLKKLFVEYNDLPCKYLVEEYKKFLEGDAEILFVHIRESEEIDKFKKYIDIPCITLLIRREKAKQKNWGNEADDNVEQYHYDFCYDNDRELQDAECDFTDFLQKIINE